MTQAYSLRAPNHKESEGRIGIRISVTNFSGSLFIPLLIKVISCDRLS